MTATRWIDVSQPARLARAADLALVSRRLWAELSRGDGGAARPARLMGMLRGAAALGPAATWRALELEDGLEVAGRWLDGVLVLRLEQEPSEDALGDVTEAVGVDLAAGHAVWPLTKTVVELEGGGES